jgi:hypothetical protein
LSIRILDRAHPAPHGEARKVGRFLVRADARQSLRFPAKAAIRAKRTRTFETPACVRACSLQKRHRDVPARAVRVESGQTSGRDTPRGAEAGDGSRVECLGCRYFSGEVRRQCALRIVVDGRARAPRRGDRRRPTGGHGSYQRDDGPRVFQIPTFEQPRTRRSDFVSPIRP